MKDEIKIVAEHFSRDLFVKDMYDRLYTGLNEWEKRVAEKYFKKGVSILDIGCGPGVEKGQRNVPSGRILSMISDFC